MPRRRTASLYGRRQRRCERFAHRAARLRRDAPTAKIDLPRPYARCENPTNTQYRLLLLQTALCSTPAAFQCRRFFIADGGKRERAGSESAKIPFLRQAFYQKVLTNAPRRIIMERSDFGRNEGKPMDEHAYRRLREYNDSLKAIDDTYRAAARQFGCRNAPSGSSTRCASSARR